MRIIFAMALFALCAGCQTVAPPMTASGKPETTIADASPEKVKPALVNKMMNGGFRITKDTPYELSFDKPVQNIAAAVLLGSRYDSQPNLRVSYSFAQSNNATRVVADLAVITNPGSAFERRTEFNSGVDAHDMQVMLDTLKAEIDPSSPLATAQRNGIVLGVNLMEASRARVAGMSGPEKGLYVINVTTGSVAEKAGIRKGDALLNFGGRQLGTLPDLASAQGSVKPGSTVKMLIWREGSEEELSAVFPAPARPKEKPKARTVRIGQTSGSND